MPADVTADLNLFDTQVSTLISVASVIVAATAASQRRSRWSTI
jgi:hypothetical protein